MTPVVRRYVVCTLLVCGIGVVLGSYWGQDRAPFIGTMTLQVGRVGAVDLVIPEASDHGGDILNIASNKYYGLEPGFRMLTSVEELYRFVAVLFDHRRARRGLVDPPYLSELNNYEGAILEVVARGQSEETTRKLLLRVERAVLANHREYFDSTVSPLTAMRDRLSSWYDRLQPGSTVTLPEESENHGTVSVDEVVRVTELLYKLDRALAPPNTHPTYRIGEIEVVRLSNRKQNLYLFGGFMLGLISSLFIIACVELVRINRRA